jgi:two-component system response regulator
MLHLPFYLKESRCNNPGGMKNEENFDVLLVEDSAEDLELTSYALGSGGNSLRYLHLRDGVEALRYIFSKQPLSQKKVRQAIKVILLDLKLPKVNGLEVLRKIRADESTKMIPVVMFSSSSQSMDMAEAYSLGVNSYVVKPVEFDKYIQKVSAISSYWSSVNQNIIA